MKAVPTVKLHIAKGLALPRETVTQTLAILARKRSGKSYAARRLAEQLFKAGLQVADVEHLRRVIRRRQRFAHLSSRIGRVVCAMIFCATEPMTRVATAE
mgnify:CR=1 FL=1